MDYWRTSVIMGCLWLFASCDTRQSISSTNAPPVEQNRVAQPDARQDFKQRQLAFLNRIREADPQQRTIERAMLNEQNELGLILDRNVGDGQNPGPHANDADGDGARISRSGFNSACLCTIEPATEDRHRPPRWSNAGDALCPRKLMAFPRTQPRKK